MAVWSGQLRLLVEEGARAPAFPAEPHSGRTSSSLAWDLSPPRQSPRSHPSGPTFGSGPGLRPQLCCFPDEMMLLDQLFRFRPDPSF